MPDQATKCVRDYMTRDVFGVLPKLSVMEALERAKQRQITHLPVIVDSKVVGIICTCDLEDAALSESISAIAHSPALTIAPDAKLSDAAHWMTKAAVGSLIVETDGKMVGILTRTDLERAGLADLEFRESACLGCGSFEHVHPNASGEWWCARCRARRGPAHAGDEIGVGD
jgi:predicted transcriptional regulator